MRRRPSPSRGKRSSLPAAAIVVAILVSSSWTAPAVSFTTASMERGASNDVVDDPNGVIGLDVANSVRKNQIDPVVNVTNSLGTQITVTVSLQNPNDGDLTLTQDGTNTADEVTFVLDPGLTETVYLDASVQVGETVPFDVTARSADSGFHGLGRSTIVESAGGGGPPGR